jgi:hypothetical protein
MLHDYPGLASWAKFSRPCGTEFGNGFPGQPVERLYGELQMLRLGVFSRIVTEAGKRLGKHHHHRYSSPRDLGGIVQRS